MRAGSIIDDVYVDETNEFGPPICFSNIEIRKMLRIVKLSEKDVFYDLGSGFGQTMIIALTEFGVKKAIGFELNKERREKSIQRLTKWSETRKDIQRDLQWEIYPYDYSRLLSGDLSKKGISLEDATVVYYCLETHAESLRKISKAWKNAKKVPRRLVYYRNCIFPEIMPDIVESPFLVSEFPFTETKNEIEWLKKITGKIASSLVEDTEPSKTELWDDLRHDYDVEGEKDLVNEYRSRLWRAVNRSPNS